MQGVGTPDLIINTGSSPHSHVMRPSEARALQSADIVFWVGPELTPWLSEPISVLSKQALVQEMLEVDGTVTLHFREDLTEDDHDGHDHEGIDPHAWLDPQNGVVWLGAIADVLANADPENAVLYRKNAEIATDEIKALSETIAAALAAAGTVGFIVNHDAYQYFETRYGLQSSGSVTDGDAAPPGPAKVAELAATLEENNVRCAVEETPVGRSIIKAITASTDIEIIYVDPTGRGLETGPSLYPELLRSLGMGLADCG